MQLATLLPALAILAPAASSAATYYQKSSDTGSGSLATSFTAANWTNESQTTAVAVSSGNDYVTALGCGNLRCLLRTPTSAATFGGDSLHVGLLDGNPGTLFLKNKAAALVIPSLVLANGAMATGDNATAKLASGTAVDVTAPVANPFLLQVGGYNGTGTVRNIAINGTISSSSDDTCLEVCRFSIDTTNAGKYNGFGEVVLAGNNSSYQGRWIVDNLDAALYATNQIRLRISAANNLGNTPSSVMTNAVTLRNGGMFAVDSSCTSLSLGKRGLAVEETGGIFRSGTLLVNMPVYGSGTLSLDLEDDATLTLNAGVNGAASIATRGHKFKFGANPSWDSTGSLVFPAMSVPGPFVIQKTTMSTDSTTAAPYETRTYFSDGSGVTSGKKYVAGPGMTMRSIRNSGSVAFPGDELTLYGFDDDDNVAQFISKIASIEFPLLRLGSYGRFYFVGSGTAGTTNGQRLKGNVEIASALDAPAAIQVNRRSYVDAAISGAGCLAFIPNTGATALTLTGDNSAYRGSMRVDGKITLSASDANQLGGEPSGDGAAARGIWLKDGGALAATADMSLADGRGIYVETLGTNSVASGATLTLNGALSFADASSELVKTGEGTLRLNDAAGSSSGKATVAAGTLALSANNALGASMEIELAGGTLAAGAVSTSAGVLSLSASSAMEVSSGAAVSFANSSSSAWASGAKLAIAGPETLEAGMVSFGNSADGLSQDQLDAITYNGKKVALRSDGSLAIKVSGFMLIFR